MDKIEQALDIADRYGSIDGGHHKTWVIDQMVRCLTGAKYNEWVEKHCQGVGSDNTCDWDKGIAP